MRMGLNIRDVFGYWQRLSHELYELVDIEQHGEIKHSNYKNGTLVRFISNNPVSSVCGYHASEEYVTVCRDNTMGTAEFLGFKKSQVKRVR
jgi:hypothetical protein